MHKVKRGKNDSKHIFKVTALVESYISYTEKKGYHVIKTGERPWRKIVISGRQNLYKFAEIIVSAFEFDFDHCFGFYSNINSDFYHDSKKQYELFADLDNVEPTEAESVKKTKVGKVWKKPGDKMTFLFDYGDGWRSLVELLETETADKKLLHSTVLEESGIAPAQYPPEEFFQ